ncbi:ABC transporter permease subunit [Deinococcus cellulosilyticus]|uniref:ABC transporter permease n=1 Tax=Deinococcus cellulosilyticus (strain DSM 18568 / NBRC 106333 / KACC 11606 / 5516J-15) TaxID=1223518 RepID=A0A511N490_DEIC1|nr:ABC transporter permease subunit [Deinococcus cellulosilyticus]GEM47652.1 ABC transporter permease [Deinococcus cellulosilyticus NBRC 106333 = KACC 11606]
MNTRAIRAVVRKDLKVAMQSKPVMLPLIIIPLIFVVVFPTALCLLAPVAATEAGSRMNNMQELLAQVSPALKNILLGLDPAQQIVVFGTVYMLAPMFLLLPLMVASVFSADSFAGEKERKTLEALAYSPISDRDLFVAKVLGSWIPAVAVSVLGFVVYTLVVNLAGYPVMQRIFFPNISWLLLVFWVSPAVAAASLGATVLVSAKVSTFQEAYQLGGVVVLPVIMLMIGQLTGVLYFSSWFVALLGLVLWGIAALLIRYGGQSFQRSKMLGSQ